MYVPSTNKLCIRLYTVYVYICMQLPVYIVSTYIVSYVCTFSTAKYQPSWLHYSVLKHDVMLM